jgi:cytochrome c oxidase assembly protein subunit 15
MPPITKEEWNKEFERYKTYPEWQQRQTMTVDDFKFIYFWEYSHRMMGRFIGLAFVLPGAYFLSRGMIAKSMYPRLGVLFGLGGSQGLIGWWMVKSGLDMDPAQQKEIRVSPYRLATHLAMAFTTYTYLVWSGLDLLNPAAQAKETALKLSAECLKHTSRIRKLAIFNGALVATTVLSGAYVAGNDAGRAFNTFPKMGDDWIPDEILALKPLWRNFFENTATVQFDHRVLALTTLGSISAMFAMAVKSPHWSTLPHASRKAFHAVIGMAGLQVALGISTLLLYVPVPLAAVHQVSCFVILFSEPSFN